MKSTFSTEGQSGCLSLVSCLRWLSCLSWTALLLCGPGLAAQDEQSLDPGDGRLPEEVIVIGRDFQELQQLVSAAEDRIYAIFNELNDDDKYDIYCRMHAELGTKIKSKLCTPGFLDDATHEEARGFLEGRAYTPPTAVISYHAPILQQKMRELALANPEFYKAIDEHRMLREALDEKKSMGGK